MKNVVISGVLVTLISAITIGSFDTYSQIKANTEHRLESKEDKIMNLLVEIKTNQVFLMKKYHKENETPK
jgi:hypothetical protein